MEKYSKHLEQVVAERTNDLTLEKQRTDRLLYSEFLGQYSGKHVCFHLGLCCFYQDIDRKPALL
jgi:hypothetical protein